jgi:hypothetical protein
MGSSSVLYSELEVVLEGKGLTGESLLSNFCKLLQHPIASAATFNCEVLFPVAK